MIAAHPRCLTFPEPLNIRPYNRYEIVGILQLTRPREAQGKMSFEFATKIFLLQNYWNRSFKVGANPGAQRFGQRLSGLESGAPIWPNSSAMIGKSSRVALAREFPTSPR